MENTNQPTSSGRKGSKHAVNAANREAFRQAAHGLRQAYPNWTYKRIAATLGIGETTVREMLKPDDAPKRPHKKKSPVPCESLFEAEERPEQLTLTSREFGTAPQTASIIAERETIAKLQTASYELLCGARKLDDALKQMDALLKAAFVKGTMAARDIQD